MQLIENLPLRGLRLAGFFVRKSKNMTYYDYKHNSKTKSRKKTIFKKNNVLYCYIQIIQVLQINIIFSTAHFPDISSFSKTQYADCEYKPASLYRAGLPA